MNCARQFDVDCCVCQRPATIPIPLMVSQSVIRACKVYIAGTQSQRPRTNLYDVYLSPTRRMVFCGRNTKMFGSEKPSQSRHKTHDILQCRNVYGRRRSEKHIYTPTTRCLSTHLKPSEVHRHFLRVPYMASRRRHSHYCTARALATSQRKEIRKMGTAFVARLQQLRAR